VKATPASTIAFRDLLGTNLRRLREEAGLSQEDLMHLADVHRTQISKYERGEVEPQAEVLARLSRALRVSAEEFFAGVSWQASPPRLVVGEGPDSQSIRPRLPQRSSAAIFPFGG
jgi:transcriptional regulator with XRE-family HTH domain